MTFVEHGLVRRILECAFDFLKFGEIASCNIAQHDLLAKPAGVAIFDEAGLSFHDLPILALVQHHALENYSKHGETGPFTPHSDELFIPSRPPPVGRSCLPGFLRRAKGWGFSALPERPAIGRRNIKMRKRGAGRPPIQLERTGP